MPTHAPHAARTRPSVALLALAPALMMALALGGCADRAPAPPPNIVIYLIDTLRQDHLGVYGYERETSPSMDALAGDSIRFSQAFATSAWTKASTASLLTGLHPRQHGATSRSSPLSGDARLWPEYLEPLEYYRAGVVTNPFVVEHWGFNRGYDLFEDLGEDLDTAQSWSQIPASRVTQRAFEILDARPADRPFFLYLHSIDPHGPIAPVKPYDTLFTKNPWPATGAEALPDKPHPRNVRNTVALYDSEIRYSDDQLGEFIAGLKQRGLYDNTVIWLVSDHGEEFLDHGRGGHGAQVFNEVVQVPLLLKLPDQQRAGAVVETPVSLIDVLVTQLNLLDQRAPESLGGRNLVDLVDASPAPVPAFFDLNLVSGTERTLTVSRGVVLGKYKYFEELLPEPGEYLFDLDADPKETNNLLESHTDTAAELRTLLHIHRSRELSGLVLRGVGSKDPEDRNWSARLRTDGRFVEVTAFDFEEGDEIEYEPGGQTLAIRTDLRAMHDNVAGRGLIQDIDSVSIRVDPPDAEVTIESNQLGRSEQMPIFLGLERERRVAPVRMTANQESLLCPQLSTMFTEAERHPGGSETALRIPPGVYTVRLPDASAGDLEIPPEMVERLKALGYM